MSRELWVSTTASTTRGRKASVTRLAAETTIAILNYDGRALLERVLPSIANQDHPSFRVVVVDNGSRDGSADWLRREWPQVELVELPENVGVTAALNRAVGAAGGEFVALLNNDIELERGWLSALVSDLRAHPEAAAACGKLLQFSDRGRIDAAGDLLAWGSAVANRGAGEVDQGQYDQPGEVFGAGAAAALYRRSAFDVVGPFDEDFWAYLEDVDWAFRARLAGFTARYVPAAVGYHMGSATTAQRPLYQALQRQNQLALVAKDYPARKLLRYAPRIAVFHGLWLAASVRDGMLGAHFRGLARGLRLLPRALRKRRAIQRGRRVDPAVLERVVDRRWVVRARR
jgi:GT2 family glycosyltransferase